MNEDIGTKQSRKNKITDLSGHGRAELDPDAHGTLNGKISTHTDGKACDRILGSNAISKGLNGLKLDRVAIQTHRHGKGEERRS